MAAGGVWSRLNNLAHAQFLLPEEIHAILCTLASFNKYFTVLAYSNRDTRHAVLLSDLNSERQLPRSRDNGIHGEQGGLLHADDGNISHTHEAPVRQAY